MKFILTYLCIFLSFQFFSINVSAEDSSTDTESSEKIQSYFESTSINYKRQAYIGESYTINISQIESDLRNFFPEYELSYTWDIFGEASQEGTDLSIDFNSAGKKQISLNIYAKTDTNNQDVLLYSTDIIPLIYENLIPIIYDSTINVEEIEKYASAAEDSGIYLAPLKIENNTTPLKEQLTKLSLEFENISNYITIWGDKEFLFSTLSSLGLNNTPGESYNFVLLSAFNRNILQSYIENSITGKNIIKSAIIVDDLGKLQLLKYPSSIEELANGLNSTSYYYTSINTDNPIHPVLFISRFINDISKQGMSNSDIYIILLLPIFFTLLSINKHIIGISLLGNVIPVFLGILLIKIGAYFTLSFFLFLILINLIVAKFLNKYTLLHTPKVVFLTILNIILFMLSYSIFQNYGLINLPIHGVLYLILLFIIAEKLILIITTKEFKEYKRSILGSIITAIICYALYHFDMFTLLLFAYPELILLLIPLNFLIGRFTGLRVTEYFRFKEIIKSVEE